MGSSAKSALTHPLRHWFILLACMVSWGVSNPLADLAVTRFSPITLTTIECLTGFIFLLATALITRPGIRSTRWRFLWWIGLLQPFAAWMLGNYGYRASTASTGVIILSSEAIFSLLIARLWLSHRFTRQTLVATLCGIGGVALAAGGSFSLHAGDGPIYFVASALLFGIYSSAMRKYLTNEDPLSLALAQTGISSIAAIAVLSIARPHIGAVPAHFWVAAIASGIFGVGLPFVAFNFLSSKMPSRITGSALNLIPIAGIAASAVLGRGMPTTIQAIGGVIVLISIWGVSRTRIPE